MQIERLFEIVYVLLNKKTVTASELAAKLGVSARTIFRDVDVLTSAGIPIYANTGRSGGFRLLDGFVLNKSLLSEKEQREILAALEALGVTQYPGGEKILDKLATLFQKDVSHWIEVDFSDWGHSDSETFEQLKQAILDRQRITFDYYSSLGEATARTAEPELLWFKHRSWYLRAFDVDKQDERVFKLSRLKRLKVSEEDFGPRQKTETTQDAPEKRHAPSVNIRLKIDASQLYRIYDEFDDSMINQADDGSFICEAVFPEDEWVYGFILSFGPFAEVLEPNHIREIITGKLKKSLETYSK